MRNLEEDRVAFCGSSMMSAQWRSGGNRWRRKEGVLHGGLLLLKAVDNGGVAAGIGGRGNGGPDVVGPWFGPGD
jgi:hypothetical protein